MGIGRFSFLWSLLAVSALFLSAGCSQQPDSGTKGQVNRDESLKLRLAYPGISTTIWPWIYAQQTGIFEAEGLDLEMNRIRGIPQIIATLLSGDIDVAWVGFDGMASAVAQGARDLRYIGEFLTEFPSYLVVTPEIESFEDLRGQSVATGGAGSMTETLFLEGLRQGGLSDPRKDTQYMNMHGPDNRLNQLFTGTFVAIALNAPWAQQAEERGYKILQYQGDLLHPWAGEGPITHSRVISSKPEALQRLINGLRRAIRGMTENRSEAVRIGAEYMALEPHMAEKVYDVMIPVFKTDGKWNLEGIQRTLDSKAGAKNNVIASDFVDDSFL